VGTVVVTWLAEGALGVVAWITIRRATVEKKRKLYPVFMAALVVVYVLPELVLEGHLPPVWLILAIAGLAIVNIWGAWFCEACGAFVPLQGIKPRERCQRCGAPRRSAAP
jgi:hypothetical protein